VSHHELPTVLPPAAEPAGGAEPNAVQALPEVKSSRLIGTLAGFGGLAGLILVLAFQWTDPLIKKNQAEALQGAVAEVLKNPVRTQRFFVIDGRLATEAPAGADTLALDRVFLGYDAQDAPTGFAMTHSEAGFQDQVLVIFAYDPRTGSLFGMKVLENKETPGLGDKIVKDSAFVSAFEGALAPLIGVKAGAGTGDEHEIDMITGATISSRAVINIINHRIEQVDPVLKAYLEGEQS